MTGTRLKIKFYQAECGDAARIRLVGLNGNVYNILVDAGYLCTYKSTLRAEIEYLKEKNEKIDIWIISHIHDDHIEGTSGYIWDIESGLIKEDSTVWLYNAPRRSNSNHSVLVSEPTSIYSGDKLTSYLIQNGKLPAKDITFDHSPIQIDEVKFSILSPRNQDLTSLRKKYNSKKFLPLDREENDTISIPMSRRNDDYNISICSFDLAKDKEDNSIENTSSIAFLCQSLTHSSIWLGDSRPSVIVEALKKLGFSIANPLICDIVKISHHASSANNSEELYSMIRCSNYVISANGQNRHLLPHKACLARILRNKNRDPKIHYKFYFTYKNSAIDRIFKIDGENVFKKYNFSVHYPEKDSNWLEFDFNRDQ
jgi:beta-lactamase superfamily II metal-dependent hydrolase